MNQAAVILAAGLGKRMRSRTAKVLHTIAGSPMLLHLIDTMKECGFDRILAVVGHQAEKVSPAVEGLGVEIVLQKEQRGTGHALLQAREPLSGFRGTLLVINGDTPLIRRETILGFIEEGRRRKARVALLTATPADPSGYGRIIRDRSGGVARIVEEKDASPRERAVREINTGIYAFEAPLVFDLLATVRPENAQREYYLTDIARAAVRRKVKVAALKAPDFAEVLGINSRGDLARAEEEMQRRIAERWMADGVTLIRPREVLIGREVSIGPDTVIYPQTVLEGKTVVGAGCALHASRIVDSTLGDGVTVMSYCFIEGALLEEGVSVGPFARLRPGAVLRKNAKVGNFVEVKKSEIGEGAKVNHLSYIGDTTIGQKANIGAGTITCNYDGVEKHRTVIGDRVFIGSDTQLVAPVEIGEGAIIAAGSTITENVPKDALAISRVPQVNKEGWAKKRREKRGR
jgi:bifunctional UDP-N-acetylglucosamine pyrophosphorylase/glucosamine-1-phosphate N-acetyltransferase